MKISLNWIKEFVDIPHKYSAKQLAELLTLRTCEAEGYEDEAVKFMSMVVGKVVKIRPHPNADKLRLIDTDISGRVVQIVCGGENLYDGMLVAVALPGALVKWHGEGELVELKETKIRGESSFGMICAEEEIGLPQLTPRKGITITDITVHLAACGKKETKPGTPLAEALELNDVIFEIDNKSLTHRPDLWGHYGMAREFAAFLGKKLKPFVARNPAVKTGQKVKVDIQKINQRGAGDVSYIAARFLGVIITGIRVEQSPQWLKNRLAAVGMRPVNNIVDITNYVMHELGHPLHAFDRRVVENDQFVIRFARRGESIETLDHKKRKLSEEDALITNGIRPLGIAGVMGGLNSEITPRTTEIILEVAAWNPLLIRKTAQRHGIRSDAAQRFEKSLDPEITGIAGHRAIELILKLCSTARIAGPITDVYPKRAKPTSVLLSTEIVNRKIGAPISEEEMIKHLRALEFGIKKAKKGFLKITVPTFRATKDINIEDDLVEEVARMHGYEKIKPSLPSLPIKLPHPNLERTLKHRSRDILSLGLGFTETSHYSFYGISEARNCLLPEAAHLLLDNPLSEDQTHLRISLLPNLLKSAVLNLYSRGNFKIYEIGRTYIKTTGIFPLEEKFIAGVIAKQSIEIFYDALGALQSFIEQFGAKGRVEECKNPPPYAHPSKCAEIKIAGKEIAVVYEVHPQVLKNFGIKAEVGAFEINFTQLVAAGQNERAYRPIPRFPGIEIDVSVLVPKRTTVREILELIHHIDTALIANLKLIDIFEDKSLGPDKKSFTFRILLQSPDRTLTDEEMKQVQERIFKTLTNSGFAIRGL